MAFGRSGAALRLWPRWFKISRTSEAGFPRSGPTREGTGVVLFQVVVGASFETGGPIPVHLTDLDHW